MDSLIHFVWQFLTPFERLQCTKATSHWADYHKLRLRAVSHSVGPLKQKRPKPSTPSTLDSERSYLNACALLRFHFNYGDFIRWLSGEHTNRHRNWDETYSTMQNVCVRPPPQSLPPVSFSRCKQASTQGVPLMGHFHSPRHELRRRDKYDNHPAVGDNIPAVMKKFAAEEEKTFHLHLPRFLVYFISGLMLNPLQWVVRKGKGRICVDCTNAAAGVDDPGSPNTWIPSPNANRPDECPPVFYGDAFQRFLRQIWRLRITHPTEPLRQHVDDIEAAFRRILYHPDMATVFAYVFQEFLIIPVGQVFGSRSAPSFFSQSSDLRAYVATCGDLSGFATPDILKNMTDHTQAGGPLAQAIADSLNPPLDDLEQESFTNSSFVDDNGVVDLIRRIARALHQSVISAYLLYGFPGKDRRGDCFAADKFDDFISAVAEYLGFEIDCDKLLVTWPQKKRQQLRDMIIEDILKPSETTRRPNIHPKDLASIIGKLQSASIVAPWGPHLAFPLMTALRQSIRASMRNRNRAAWFWRKGHIRLGGHQVRHFSLIADFLGNDEDSNLWSCPIGLMIPRDPTLTMLSDASYAGIGGWSPDYQIMWRVMHADLIALGLPLKQLHRFQDEPLDVKSAGLHINPLEFLATIVNIWLHLKLAPRLGPSPSGHIVALLSDNTSALSWCRLTTVMKDLTLQPWARLVATLLVFARTQNSRIQPEHIPGKDNVEADRLSRCDDGVVPSWDSVTKQNSRLRMCHLCLLPRSLLSALADLISSQLTEERLVERTTKLLTLEPVILSNGLPTKNLISTLCES